MGIVVVGSVAFDSIESLTGKVKRAIGGSATYFSMAACNFCPVKLVAVVGDDFGEDYRGLLESKGIDLAGLVTRPGRTFHWAGRYGEDPNERETLATELGVFEGFRPELPPEFRKTGWIFLGNIDPELQLAVLDQVEGRPYVGCDTMNYWIEGKPAELRKVLERTDIIFINDQEARQLSAQQNLVNAARRILWMGPTAVVIKKGEHGSLLFTQAFTSFAPAYPLDLVIDPTGAGDSFAGGFMGHLAGGGGIGEQALRVAMYHGAVTASFTCEDFSVDRLRRVSRDDIEQRFRELAEMVRVK